MSDFFNYSPVNDKFNLLLNNNLVNVIRTQARIILTPYFRKVAITTHENENGQQYPVITSLAERIITQVYQDGELSITSWERAKAIALPFVQKLRAYEKECLAFYFCTKDTFVENLEEEGPGTFLEDIPAEHWEKSIGNVIQELIKSLSQNSEELASRIVNELKHLQEIFSTEDENNWDASSLACANENFNSYTGTDIKLIPIPIDDFEYWDGIIEETDDEEEEEEEVEDELEEEIIAEIEEELKTSNRTMNYHQVELVFKQWEGVFSTISEFEEVFLLELSERLQEQFTYSDKYGEVRTIKPIDHYPNLQIYEVWEKAFMCKGKEVKAKLHGQAKARNFTQACHIVMCENFLHFAAMKNDVDHGEFSRSVFWSYNPLQLTYNGRKLYSCEKMASNLFDANNTKD